MKILYILFMFFFTSLSLAENSVNIPVLMLHKVSDAEPPSRDNIQTKEFRQLMAMLYMERFSTLTMDEVANIYAGTDSPKKPVALTFDDGWVSMLDAISIMDEFGMKATFYIITSMFQNPLYLSYRDVSLISQNPRYQIGAHSQTHHMKYIDDVTKIPEEDLIKEMRESKKILDGVGVGNVTTYAWPFGVSTRSAVQAAIATGFKSQALVWKFEGLNNIQPQHIITRINISGTCTADRLKEILESKKYEDCK